MNSSLETRPPRDAGRKAALCGLVSLAAAFCLTGFAATPANAQFFEYYYDDQPYPEAAYPLYPERPVYRDYPVSPGPRGGATISLADVRQRVAQRGMHLVATPRRKGRIYLAETEDGHGVRHRLVFDAFDGHLLENTVLGPKTAPRASAETADKAAAERTKTKPPARGDEPPPPDDPGGRPTR